jgi:hypothetical protein
LKGLRGKGKPRTRIFFDLEGSREKGNVENHDFLDLEGLWGKGKPTPPTGIAKKVSL